MPEAYDVIIVGAGPGGATAAYFLGHAGFRVLVIEKESLPRYKTCGGALSDEMFISVFPFSFQDVVEARPQVIAYSYLNHLVSIPDPSHRVCTVMRANFDLHILSHAKADILHGDQVERVREDSQSICVETHSGQTYTARYLIGADGANSIVAHQLGLRRKREMAAALEAEVTVSSRLLRRYGNMLLFIFGEIRDGYLWIFPKGEHLSVGIGALHPKPGDLQSTLARVMARYGISLEGVTVHGHPIPLTLRREPIATRRALLVGDAAGLADPISGEGIRLAITSGKLAAEAIISGQTEGYTNLIWQKIGREHRISLQLAWLFYRFLPLTYTIAVPNPLSTQLFLDVLSGKSSYGRVCVWLFASLPLFWFTEAVAAFAGLFGGRRRREQIRNLIYG
jgi:geranylgeranyl reductase family protein